MKIALVTAPKDGVIAIGDKYEPIGISCLASFLRTHKHEVIIKDPILFALSVKELASELLAERVELIGISMIGPNQFKACIDLASLLRREGYDGHITCGGIGATFLYENLLTFGRGCIDSVVRGEGEYPLLELLERLGSKRGVWKEIKNLTFLDELGIVQRNPMRSNISDLDSLPFMARDLLPYVVDNVGNMASILTGRGCWGNCSFCATPNFYRLGVGKSVRQRSVDNVIEEIKYLYHKFDVDEFRFYDEAFIVPGEKGRRRLSSFISAIRNIGFKIRFFLMTRAPEINAKDLSDLKEIGLVSICVGIESGCRDELKSLNKGTTIEINEKAIEVLNDVNIPLTSIGCILFGPDTELW